MSGTSLGARLAAVGGRPSGFDYLRIVLALLVVLWHSVAISHGPLTARWIVSGQARSLIAIILPMFFALSGFLVAGSLVRCRSLISFLGLRAIRIFPALIVEVVVSACLIGAVMTTLPIREYYASSEFHDYFWNIIGYIHFSLPGVFHENPLPNIVNGQLWTIPFELECYIMLAFLAVAGIVRWRVVVWLGIVLLIGVELAHVVEAGVVSVTPTAGAVSGRILVGSFLAGVAIYLYRDCVVWSMPLGMVSGAFTLVLLAVPYGDLLVPLPAAYLTVWLGLMNPTRVGLLKGSDYSYGVFLYGFVIQQMVAALFPWSHYWLTNFALTMPLAFALAALSWHLVEKPALKLRNPLMALEQRLLASFASHRFLMLSKIALAAHKAQRQGG